MRGRSQDSVQNLAGRGCSGGRSTQNEEKVRHTWLCSPHVACGLSSVPKLRVATASLSRGYASKKLLAVARGTVNGKATGCHRSFPRRSPKTPKAIWKRGGSPDPPPASPYRTTWIDARLDLELGCIRSRSSHCLYLLEEDHRVGLHWTQ
jgi:hypothetical protein